MSGRVPPELPQLAEAFLDAEQSRVSVSRAAERRILDEVSALRAERARLTDPSALNDFGSCGRLVAWMAWCDSRTAALMRELAALRADREVLLAASRRAFGRRQALATLVERERVHGAKYRRWT
jgi:hypothetical protein